MAKKRDNDFELTMALQNLFKTYLRGYVVIDGVVTEIDDDTFTCTVEINGTPFSGVINNVLSNHRSDFYCKPKVNTKCLVCWRDGNINLPQLIQCDEYDLFIFNQGTLGGMVKVADLVTQLNKIENQQNAILQALKGITVSSTPFPFAPVFSSINNLTPTTRANVENTKILQ